MQLQVGGGRWYLQSTNIFSKSKGPLWRFFFVMRKSAVGHRQGAKFYAAGQGFPCILPFP